MDVQAAIFLAAFHTATDEATKKIYWQMFLDATTKVAANPETVQKIVTVAAEKVIEKEGPKALGRACMPALLKGLAENFGRIAVGESAMAATGRVAAGRVAGAVIGWPAVAVAALLSVGCTGQNMKDASQSDQQAAQLFIKYLERYVAWSAKHKRLYPKRHIEAPWTFEEFRMYQGTMKLPHA